MAHCRALLEFRTLKSLRASKSLVLRLSGSNRQVTKAQIRQFVRLPKQSTVIFKHPPARNVPMLHRHNQFAN